MRCHPDRSAAKWRDHQRQLGRYAVVTEGLSTIRAEQIFTLRLLGLSQVFRAMVVNSWDDSIVVSFINGLDNNYVAVGPEFRLAFRSNVSFDCLPH